MQKSLLLISHSWDYIDDISECKEFATSLTFNVKHRLENLGVRCHAIAGMPWLGAVKSQKSFYQDFDRLFDKTLLEKFDNVLIVSANPLKLVKLEILNYLKNNVKNKLMYMSERPHLTSDLINFHSMPSDDLGNPNNIFIGPMYNSEYLYPEKQYNNLVLHIDHHYEGRYDCSNRITELISSLEKNQMFLENWNDLEIYYHGIKLGSINEFDFYNRPPNIPYSELTAIYRKSHIGFISHKETLGMYPVELAAAGVIPVLLDIRLLPLPMQSLTNCFGDSDSFWDEILPLVTRENAERISKNVSTCSYDIGVEKIYREL